jgi:hypothetical protein
MFTDVFEARTAPISKEEYDSTDAGNTFLQNISEHLQNYMATHHMPEDCIFRSRAMVTSHLKKTLHFMDPKGSCHCPKQPSTSHYPKQN